MKDYTIKHSNKEIQAIYNISDNNETQNRLMSLLSYYKKYSIDGVLKYSINKLYSMYVRYHKHICKRHFYNLMNKIKSALFTPVVQTKVQTKVQTQNTPQTVATTDLEDNFKKPNNKYINNNTITNTINTNPSELVTLAELKDLTIELLKEFKIKSKAIKGLVIEKLSYIKAYSINAAIKYITKVIAEKKGVMEANRELYKRVVNAKKREKVNRSQGAYNKTKKINYDENRLNKANSLNFNNFGARSIYSNTDAINALESVLCGYSSVDTLNKYNLTT